MELSSDNSGSTEHDVDAILAQAYGGTQNPSQGEPSRTPAPEKAPEAPQAREYEFNARGQAIKIKENDPRFSQWLSQGHDYSQNINTFKQERDGWEKSKQDWEKQWGTYREIDQFAKQNPDWWSSIEQSYQQRLSTPNNVPPEVKQYLDQRFEPIAQDIPLMKQFLQEMQTQKMEQQVKQEDDKLVGAIKSIQDKYPNLDFAAKDQTGLSLEQRVLDHAIKNGHQTFRAAFLDYYHDDLERLAETRGRESISQEMQKRKKLGLLDEAPAPGGKSNSMPFGNQGRPKSWGDPQLSAESILKEFKFS